MDNLEWKVTVHLGVDDVLELIQHRNDPGYMPGSRWFATKEDADHYAFTTGLKTGRQCSVIHRDQLENSTLNQVCKILKGRNDE